MPVIRRTSGLWICDHSVRAGLETGITLFQGVVMISYPRQKESQDQSLHVIEIDWETAWTQYQRITSQWITSELLVSELLVTKLI